MSGLLLELMPRLDAALWWDRLLQGLSKPEAAFGPEYLDPRPRVRDTYYLALDGGVPIGMVYTQRPAPTTITFAIGLFEAHRGRGKGAALRDLAIDFCFSHAKVLKVESEIYTSNAHSLGALRNGHERMIVEGLQRESIYIDGQPYDRMLLGLKKSEWCPNSTSRMLRSKQSIRNPFNKELIT